MKNGIVAFVDALSAMISPPLEATFDYIEYRFARAEQRSRQMQLARSSFQVFKPVSRLHGAEEIHVTGFAG